MSKSADQSRLWSDQSLEGKVGTDCGEFFRKMEQHEEQWMLKGKRLKEKMGKI